MWFIQDTKGVMESRAPTQNTKESGYLGWAMSSLKTSVWVPMLSFPAAFCDLHAVTPLSKKKGKCICKTAFFQIGSALLFGHFRQYSLTINHCRGKHRENF